MTSVSDTPPPAAGPQATGAREGGSARIPEQELLATLRRHVEAWYRNAYTDITSQTASIDYYSLGSRQRAEFLLGPFLAELMASPPRRVLDVGCGYASIPTYLAWLWPQTEFLATDLASHYYPVGQAAAAESGLTNIRYETRAIGEIDMVEEYDLVLSSNMLNFLTSRAALQDGVERFWRATAPSGRLCIYTPHFWQLREPFTGYLLLHLLPRTWQHNIVRKMGKRSTLMDVRTPSLGEIHEVLSGRGARRAGIYPASRLQRMKNTHLAVWYRK